MKAKNFALILAVLCFAVVQIGRPVAAQEKPASVEVDGKINWVYDYAEGKRLAAESGKPMFVVFRCER